jgi:integrase
MRLTDSKLKGLKPQKIRYIEWDDGCPGLGVRISISGKKSFVFMYRFEGKARMMTLGSYPSLSLADARTLASKARSKVVKGDDPGSKLINQKREEREAFTVKSLVREYLEKHAKVKKKSWKEDERVLNKDIVPKWGNRKANSITRRDVVLLLDQIKERAVIRGGRGTQANRVLAIIRKMFNFAISRSILEHSPCVQIEAPAKEKRRDRVLTEPEIKKFWKGLDKAKMAEQTRLILKLILLTAQRKGEIILIEKTEIDKKLNWWTQPGDKTKNGYPHKVWLTPISKSIVKRAMELSGDSKWLFPSFHGDGHITAQSIDHAVRDNRKDNPSRNTSDVFGIPHFTPHDLRRTAATSIAGLGVSRFVLKKILNHADQDVTGVYDRHSYDKEKRLALEGWSRKLQVTLNKKSTNK